MQAMLSLILTIVLIVKFWHMCNAMEELNRTVQLMAYDLKELREGQKK